MSHGDCFDRTLSPMNFSSSLPRITHLLLNEDSRERLDSKVNLSACPAII